VGLCDSYEKNNNLFNDLGYNICFFNYSLKSTSFLNKMPKLRNLIYGIKQARHLVKDLAHDKDAILHIHTSRRFLFLKDILLAYYVNAKLGKKAVLTIHVGDINTVFTSNIISRWAIALMNKCLDKVIFLSYRMRDQFEEKGLKKNIGEVVYNFFDVRICPPEEKTKNKISRIIYIGSINREKGIFELFDALMSINEPYHFDLCGTILEEDIKQDIYSYISQMGDKITYHGYVNLEQKEALMSRADILVLPSYREGLPISILEALSNSCAVIATPVGAIPEILSSDNAVIVPPKNADLLKQALIGLIVDEKLRSTMQANNFVTSNNYSVESHIHKIAAIYDTAN